MFSAGVRVLAMAVVAATVIAITAPVALGNVQGTPGTTAPACVDRQIEEATGIDPDFGNLVTLGAVWLTNNCADEINVKILTLGLGAIDSGCMHLGIGERRKWNYANRRYRKTVFC